MHDAYESFRDCGWASYLCVLIAIVGVVVGLVGVALLATRVRGAPPVLGAIAMVLGLTALGAGLLGREMGLGRMEAALSGESIDPSQKARIRAVGTQEAGQCVSIGAATGALPFLMGVIALGIGLSLREKPAAA